MMAENNDEEQLDGTLPYQFEPTLSADSDEGTESDSDSDDSRLQDTSWFASQVVYNSLVSVIL